MVRGLQRPLIDIGVTKLKSPKIGKMSLQMGNIMLYFVITTKI
jgi:hypothetical protein